MKGVNIYAELGSSRNGRPKPIRIRIDYNRKHIGIDSIGYSVPDNQWEKSTRSVKKSHPNSHLINQTIVQRIARHNDFILKRELTGLSVTKELIIKYLNNDTAFYDFTTFATHTIDTKRLSDGKGYGEDTKRRYKDEIKRVSQFYPDLKFKNITSAFLEEYKKWLMNDYIKKDGTTLSHNSIWKALSFVRLIYNEAVKHQVILPDNNPFINFKVGSYETNIEKIKFLTTFQLDQIEKYITETPGLDNTTINIGWRFLSMCVSGLRISDAMRLDEAMFTQDGLIQFKPHKTKRHQNVATIPISNERQKRYFTETLKRPLPNTDPKSFRSTFNNRLKIIAAGAGITGINLTSHVGRHTMGSFLVDANVSDRPAMAILGIKSNETLKVYAHLKEDKLKSEAMKLNNVM